MSEFLSVLHVYTIADDHVSAIAGVDDIRLGIERLLDEGEAVDVVQTIPQEELPHPSAQLAQLRRARNILLRTRTKENYDLARLLDQAIHSLAHRLDPGDALITYDWGKFIEVLKETLNGGNPLDY